MARSARQGNLTLTDGYGRITAETSSSPGPESLLVGDLKPGPGATLYAWLGDWFAWLNVIVLAVLLAAGRPWLPPALPMRYPGTSNSL
jgi:apolipoprotein N-acyltransferase